MKRFIIAVIILIITVSSAALLNSKTIKSADEIIKYIELNDTENIKKCWDKNRILYSVVLTEEKTERIGILIKYASEDKISAAEDLKNEMISLKNELKLNVNNIL